MRKLICIFIYLGISFNLLYATQIRVVVAPNDESRFSPNSVTINGITDTLKLVHGGGIISGTYTYYYDILANGKANAFSVSDWSGNLGYTPSMGLRLFYGTKDSLGYFSPTGSTEAFDYTFTATRSGGSQTPFYLTVHYGTSAVSHNHTINLGNNAFNPAIKIVSKGDTVKIKYTDTNSDSYYITAPSGLSFSNTFLNSGELDISDAVKNATPGDYIITAQNFANATLNISFTLRIQAATSVENYKLDKVSVAPNPVADVLSIKGLDKDATLSVYNLAGVLQMQKQLAGNAAIDVSQLPQAVYVVKLHTKDGGYFEGKIVKE